MWFGTEDGLNRYDGYEIKVYRNDPDDPKSLRDNTIRALIEDNNDRLWVGGGSSGLCYLDMRTGKFELAWTPDNATGLEVMDLALDSKGLLWIGTWNGLFSLDTKSEDMSVSLFMDNIPGIRTLHVDRNDDLWLGSEEKGLYKYSKTRKVLNALKKSPGTKSERMYDIISSQLTSDIIVAFNGGIQKIDPETQTVETVTMSTGNEPVEVTSLCYDHSNTLWLGTSNSGLITIDEVSGKYQTHSNNLVLAKAVSGSGIVCLYTNSDGLIWVGTRGEALQFFDPGSPVKFYGAGIVSHPELSDPSVRAILAGEHTLWVGGYSGLERIDRQQGTIEYLYQPGSKNGLTNKNVYALAYDQAMNLWIGTEGGGLFIIENDKTLVTPIPFHSKAEPEADHVFEILKRSDGSMLLGTGAGLYHLDGYDIDSPTIKAVKIHLGGHQKLGGEDVFAIIEASDGSFWVGTSTNGVYHLNGELDIIAHIKRDPRNRHSLSSDRIKSIYEDRKGRLWIGTGGGGLNLWEPGDKTFQHYNENDGLADNTIYGILEDDIGRLWLSTNNGLSCFDPKSEKVLNYGREVGLQSIEFNTGAFYKTAGGEMFFGGVQGLNSFWPEELSRTEPAPTVKLTELLLENRPIDSGTGPLTQRLVYMDEIELNYSDDIVSVEFSAMNFQDARGILYRYQLSGLKSDWVYTGANHRKATFTHLPQGKHLLKVQARTKRGAEFGPAAELTIGVAAAPWLSWYAWIAYVAVVLLILQYIRRNEIRKLNLQADLEQNKKEAQKLIEIDEMKSRLISNVSAEIKNPLTLLDAQLNKLGMTAKGQLGLEAQRKLKEAQNSISRVSELSEQIFELAGFASGKIKLQTRKEKLGDVLNKIVDDFKGQFLSVKRNLNLVDEGQGLEVYLDRHKLEQVMINLLSNAMKYSTEQSTVTVKLTADLREDSGGTGTFAVVSVSNRGVGITPKDLANVFDRLYQVDMVQEQETSGAGLGLALVKELVELHGGSIIAESVLGGETTFTFTIPTGSEHLSPGEILETQQLSVPVLSAQKNRPYDPTLTKILIVDDEPSILDFLNEGLQELYSVIMAQDGQEALELARAELPDLIISDVFIPKLTGMELLQEIRADKVLSHVPVILLTGQISNEDRLNAYRAAANDFIGKPFKLEELLVRIENILSQRNQLIDSLKADPSTTMTSQGKRSKTDERFFLKLRTVIEDNLDQSDLTVDTLAREVFMSKRQLERRLKDLTGQTPSDLIRQTRLFKARKYLMEGSFATIAEMSYAVGFKNVKYFSRLFKNQFNQSPADILRS